MLPQINNITGVVSILIKILVFIGTVVYLIFASIVVKQVNTLSKNIRDSFNGIIITAAYIHLIAVIILVFLVLLLL